MMGFEAVAAIRAMPDLAGVPIVAVSASVLDMDRAQSQRVGCDDFLSKPVDIDLVFAMLERYLKLEWTFVEVAQPDAQAQAPAEEVADGALVAPPREELEVLYELARFGNMEGLVRHADRLAALSQRYQPFAREIQRLAEDFDDEQIQELVKQHLF
jgi:DNA-binding response OmpR family regulator